MHQSAQPNGTFFQKKILQLFARDISQCNECRCFSQQESHNRKPPEHCCAAEPCQATLGSEVLEREREREREGLKRSAHIAMQFLVGQLSSKRCGCHAMFVCLYRRTDRSLGAVAGRIVVSFECKRDRSPERLMLCSFTMFAISALWQECGSIYQSTHPQWPEAK